MTQDTAERVIPTEFTDRVCNILIVCIKGMRDQLAFEDPLNQKLEQLEKVIRKAARIGQVSDLGKSIEDFFKGKSLENQFKESEKEETKTIVLSMVGVLKEVVGNLGSCDSHFDDYIQQIDSAQNMKDILEIKKHLTAETQKIKDSTQQLRKELECSQETIGELTKKLEDSKNESMVDPLTKTLNRAAYNMKVGHALREFNITQKTSVLMVCDIDHFKKFNDTHGHKLGDKVLCAVASSIQNSIRKSDNIFRYGGEEFVVLLKDCPLEVGKRIGEKIRSTIEKDYLVHQEQKISVTISIGVTALKPEDTEETFFERADKAMYRAKEEGRNRMEVEK